MGLQDGRSYIASLRDGREVWLDGERVADVTRHPALRETIASLAELYDLQHDPALAERLTYRDEETGERCAVAFQLPRSRADLARKRDAYRIWAEASCGHLARSPDYVNGNVMTLAEAAEFFGRYERSWADNVLRHHQRVRRGDVFSTHALNNPTADRSRAVSRQERPDATLHVVRETDAGAVVRGAKLLATLSPMAQELMVLNSRALQPDEDRYALAFSVPIATPGLRLICREPLNRNAGAFDHPLAFRYDEMDALCVFEDVLVPWERMFIYRNVEACNALRRETSFRYHAAHQSLTRGLVRLEFTLGVAIRAVELVGSGDVLHVRQRLGTLLSYTHLVDGALALSEERCEPSPYGTVRPAFAPLQSARNLFPRFYAEMLDFIKDASASALIALPAERDFESPIADLVDTYYRGANTGAREKTALFKLAWDLSCDGFGQRGDLYERFYAGDTYLNTAAFYADYPKERLTTPVKRFLERGGGSRSEAAPGGD
jgi:4-hydroxyphenylacetate 3-monooxygenase oxygenase component